MSLFGGIMDSLFGIGGDPQIPEVEWDELAKLMKLGIDENRYNQNGLFTSNTWDDDKGTLTTSVNPAIQGGLDQMLGRVNQGSPGYDRAGAYRPLLESMNFGQLGQARPMPERRPFTPTAPPEGYPTQYKPYGG